MKAFLRHPRAKSILFNGQYVDMNQEVDLPFNDLFRLSRISEVTVETIYMKTKYDPSIWKDKKSYAFMSDIDSASGWGNVSINLIKYSDKEKHNIGIVGNTWGVQEPSVLIAKKTPFYQEGAAIFHEQPRIDWFNTPFAKNIAIVPFETTRIPGSWIGRINHLDALFTCCEQNIQAFKDSGIKIPIELIHWGIDPEKFYKLERPERPFFSFGSMGALSDRKGTDILIKAFLEAFPTEKDVRLICKTSGYGFPWAVHDKRIIIQQSPCTHEELLNDFFKKIDCFVFPTRGEGFGLPPLEAMATGLPVIVTGWAGILEYMRPEYGWMLDYKMVPATAFTEKVYKEDCGEWSEPDFNQLVETMRYAYNNRDEVKKKGDLASEYVKKEWLWSDKIKMYHSALEKHL